METQKVCYIELKGTYEEIGKQIAKKVDRTCFSMPAPDFFTEQDIEDALHLYDTYCPGIRDELEGFSKESEIPVKDIAYTWMTYLVPRCSGLSVLGGQMADGHTRLARNYEFSIEEEDLTVCRTQPEGKYAHIGGTIATFGRCEGINECGLAVSMSSCGMPVGNIIGMRKAELKGLQFWAIIRSLLENCKDVDEALSLVMKMPIAYNINLYLADSAGNAALVETMNGKIAYERISSTDTKQSLCGTNHIAIPSFQDQEPAAMRNSVVRLNKLEQFSSNHPRLEEKQIRDFFLKKYPEGMTTHYYEDWFGTIKTVVMDTVERRFSICWFGLKENGWEDYIVGNSLDERNEDKKIIKERAEKELFEFIPLNA